MASPDTNVPAACEKTLFIFLNQPGEALNPDLSQVGDKSKRPRFDPSVAQEFLLWKRIYRTAAMPDGGR
jgi:hypothetical protein